MSYGESGIFFFSFLRFLSGSLYLCQTIVAIKSDGLHFVFIGKFVEGKSLSTDPCINIWAIISIILNDVS